MAFTTSIIKLVAPTLEELVWEIIGYPDEVGLASFGSELVRFRQLKKLEMKGIRLADDTVLSALIPSDNGGTKLEHLCLNIEEQKFASFLAKRGNIPTLKHLNWVDFMFCESADLFISFISANPQVETFRLNDYSSGLVDKPLIPLLALTFNKLTSLSIIWDTTHILPESLRLIGSITTLKHLWLRAGRTWFGDYDWLVDHDCLGEKLSPLKQLEWLALTRDQYPNGNEDITLDRPPKSQKWENHHRRLMVVHAKRYARSHPKLEWVYFGQIPMSIKRTGDRTGDVKAVPLSQVREDCESLLLEMWGEDHDDWSWAR